MKFGKLLKELTEGNPQMSEQPLIRYKELKKHLKSIKKHQEHHTDGAQAEQQAEQQTQQAAAELTTHQQQQQQHTDHQAQDAPAAGQVCTSLSPEERAFVDMLNQDLLRFNRFFMDKEEEAVIKLQALSDSIKQHHQAGGEQLQALKAQLVDFHGEMVLLLHWSLLNYAAVAKILKKHDKQSGLLLRAPYLANVLQQPFYSTSIMSRLVRVAEEHINTLVAREGQRHGEGTAAAAATAATAATTAGDAAAAATPADGHSAQAAGPATAAARNSSPSGVSTTTAAQAEPGPGAAAGAAAGPATAEGRQAAAAAKSDSGELAADSLFGDASGMCARTRVALQTWQHLCSNASTPSTVLPASSQELARALRVRKQWSQLLALAPIMQQSATAQQIAALDSAGSGAAAAEAEGVQAHAGAEEPAAAGGEQQLQQQEQERPQDMLQQQAQQQQQQQQQQQAAGAKRKVDAAVQQLADDAAKRQHLDS